MEPDSPDADLLSERRHRVRRVHSRIPVDTVLWALLFCAALPLGFYYDCFRPEHATLRAAAGDRVLLWLSLAFGVSGTLILAVVRYPLYVRRHHHGFQPRELPHPYRPTFWVSYMLLIVGLAVLCILVVKQRLM